MVMVPLVLKPCYKHNRSSVDYLRLAARVSRITAHAAQPG